MEDFDFNAPVTATIIYDDDDEDTMDIKPSLQDTVQIKESVDNVTYNSLDMERKPTNGSSIDLQSPVVDIKPKSSKIDNEKICFDSVSASCTEKTMEVGLAPSVFIPLDMPSLDDIYTNSENITQFNELSSTAERKRKNTCKDIPQKRRNNETFEKLTMQNNYNSKMRRSDEKHKNKGKELHSLQSHNQVSNSNNGWNANETYQKQNLNPIHKNNKIDTLDCSKFTAAKTQQNSVYGPFDNKSDRDKNITVEIKITPTSQTTDHSQPIVNSFLEPHNSVDKTVVNYIQALLNTVSEHMLLIMSSYQAYIKVQRSYADPKVKEMASNKYMGIRSQFFDLSYSSVMNIILPRKDDPLFVKSFLEDTIKIAQSKSLNYSYADIEPLYFDMIKWVQQKQHQIKNINVNLNNLTLVNEQQKPTIPPNQQEQQQSTQQNQQFNKRRSSQPRHPNRSVSESHLQPGFIYQPPHHQTPHQKPLPPYRRQSEQVVQAAPVSRGYCISQWNGQNIQPVYTRNVVHQTQSPHNMPTNYSIQQMQALVNNSANFNNGSMENYNHKQATYAPHTTDNSIAYSRDFRQNYVEAATSQNSQSAQPDNSVQADYSRSSISRDSGFMSPLNFQNSNNLLMPEVPELNQSVTPLITHVTSLNPNAAQIDDGYCMVCGKVTKQKCLGCFKTYYCSHPCQFLDWKTHQYICK